MSWSSTAAAWCVVGAVNAEFSNFDEETLKQARALLCKASQELFGTDPGFANDADVLHNPPLILERAVELAQGP